MAWTRAKPIDDANCFSLAVIPEPVRNAVIADGFGYCGIEPTTELLEIYEGLDLVRGFVRVEIIPDSEFYRVVKNASLAEVTEWYTRHEFFESLKYLVARFG